jgi:hypothetical protein
MIAPASQKVLATASASPHLAGLGAHLMLPYGESRFFSVRNSLSGVTSCQFKKKAEEEFDSRAKLTRDSKLGEEEKEEEKQRESTLSTALHITCGWCWFSFQDRNAVCG